jgi:hypothetical protein
MTAETCNDKGDGQKQKRRRQKQSKSRSPAGMTTKKSKNAKQKKQTVQAKVLSPLLSYRFPYCFPIEAV